MSCSRRTSSRFDDRPAAVALVVQPGIHPRHHLDLFIRGRIRHDVLEQEPVGLRLGEGIGAFLVDRVLGGDHQERLGNRVDAACDGRLPFLHRLEHRALRLGAGSVDLVEQHDVGVHRAQLGGERVRRRIVDLGADDVARQQVRRALDALEAAVDGFGDDAGGRRLGQPGNALDQDVPAGQQADQQRLAQILLSDDLRRERIADRADDALRLGDVLADPDADLRAWLRRYATKYPCDGFRARVGRAAPRRAPRGE